jgi:hypothetical protein
LNLGGTDPSIARLNAVLACGVSQDQTFKHWKEDLDGFSDAENELRIDDETFWDRAPQLSGDWPASLRRGFVYDFETLRMTIRPPAGVIPGYWDGMQIQCC